MDLLSAEPLPSLGCLESVTNKTKLQRISRFAGYDVLRVAKELEHTFPISPRTLGDDVPTFWFNNEFTEKNDKSDLDFSQTIHKLRDCPQIKDRCVSIVTGESGLMCCLPELSKISSMIIHVDYDSHVLKFVSSVFSMVTLIHDITEYQDVVSNALSLIEGITDDDRSSILKDAENYKRVMNGFHCFSSKHRLHEFKESLEVCHIQPVLLNYFSEEDLQKLTGILNKHQLSVRFFNISNVGEYYPSFYLNNPFSGHVVGIEPTLHMRILPLKHDTLCAFSAFSSDHMRTSVCQGDQVFQNIRKINMEHALSYVSEKLLVSPDTLTNLADLCCAIATVNWNPRYIKETIYLLRLVLSGISPSDKESLGIRLSEIEQVLQKNQSFSHGECKIFLDIVLSAYRQLNV